MHCRVLLPGPGAETPRHLALQRPRADCRNHNSSPQQCSHTLQRIGNVGGRSSWKAPLRQRDFGSKAVIWSIFGAQSPPLVRKYFSEFLLCIQMNAVLSNLTRGCGHHMCPVRSVSILQCIVITPDNAGIGRGESEMLLKCAENQNIWIVAERCSRLGGLVVVNCVYWLFMTNNCNGRKWVIINLRIISQH